MADEVWKQKGSGKGASYGKVSEGTRGHQTYLRNMMETQLSEYEEEIVNNGGLQRIDLKCVYQSTLRAHRTTSSDI